MQKVRVLYEGQQHRPVAFVEQFATDQERQTKTFEYWPMFLVDHIARRLGATIVDRDTHQPVEPSHDNLLLPPWFRRKKVMTAQRGGEPMYTDRNFKTKKALKEAVANGEKVAVNQPGGIFPSQRDGTCYLEGPHYPEPHRWYAQAEIKDGIIIKVK